jgi:hypothetical protein
LKFKELIAGCIFFFISCLFYLATLSFPTPPVQAAGPAFWPKVMSIILGIFSIALIIKSLNKLRKDKNTQEVKPVDDASDTGSEVVNFKKPIIGMFSTGFFILSLYLLGFIFGTISYFIIITVLVSQNYSWKKFFIALIQASILVVTIYFLFGEFLNIYLPSGIVFN